MSPGPTSTLPSCMSLGWTKRTRPSPGHIRRANRPTRLAARRGRPPRGPRSQRPAWCRPCAGRCSPSCSLPPTSRRAPWRRPGACRRASPSSLRSAAQSSPSGADPRRPGAPALPRRRQETVRVYPAVRRTDGPRCPDRYRRHPPACGHERDREPTRHPSRTGSLRASSPRRGALEPPSEELHRSREGGMTIPPFGTERVGFEPTRQFDPPTRFPVVHLQPLGHLSRQATTLDGRLAPEAAQRPSSRTPGSFQPRWWASSWRSVRSTWAQSRSRSQPKSRSSVSW